MTECASWVLCDVKSTAAVVGSLGVALWIVGWLNQNNIEREKQ